MATAPPSTSAGGSGDVMDGRRTILARDENMRHIRHDSLLERWPILAEYWAEAVENARIGAIDRTPGAASFGR